MYPPRFRQRRTGRWRRSVLTARSMSGAPTDRLCSPGDHHQMMQPGKSAGALAAEAGWRFGRRPGSLPQTTWPGHPGQVPAGSADRQRRVPAGNQLAVMTVVAMVDDTAAAGVGVGEEREWLSRRIEPLGRVPDREPGGCLPVRPSGLPSSPRTSTPTASAARPPGLEPAQPVKRGPRNAPIRAHSPGAGVSLRVVLVTVRLPVLPLRSAGWSRRLSRHGRQNPHG